MIPQSTAMRTSTGFGRMTGNGQSLTAGFEKPSKSRGHGGSKTSAGRSPIVPSHGLFEAASLRVFRANRAAILSQSPTTTITTNPLMSAGFAKRVIANTM